jgi:hypothetical protein
MLEVLHKVYMLLCDNWVMSVQAKGGRYYVMIYCMNTEYSVINMHEMVFWILYIFFIQGCTEPS